VLWGIPYLFIKVAVDDGVPPAFLAWVRVLLAALVLGTIAWRSGLFGPLRGRGRVLAAYGAFEIAVPFPLIAAGEQRVSSSLAAILIATVPLIIAVLAYRFAPSERASGARLVGLLVGFAGVVVLVGLDVAGRPGELLGAGLIFVAALGYAIGPMIYKHNLSDADPRAAMAVSLALAAAFLTPFALLDVPSSTPSAEALASLVVLGLLCTAAAFVMFARLLLEVGPGRASVITYVAPVVAVGLGIAVLGERPGPGAVAGLLLIIAGSWLSTGGRLPPVIVAASERLRGRRLADPAADPRPETSGA